MVPVAQGESESSVNRPVIVLTGFGSFNEFGSNSSKELAESPPNLKVVETIAASGIDGIDLQTEIFSFEYTLLEKRTQQLIERYKPTLTVLQTKLDLEKIIAECKTPVPVYLSQDAGLFICEFAYYCNLATCEKALFIHIPKTSREFPLAKLVETVERIIVLAVQECLQKPSALTEMEPSAQEESAVSVDRLLNNPHDRSTTSPMNLPAISNSNNRPVNRTAQRPIVVLTGYGLFSNYTSNSSKEVVERIAASGIDGVDLRTEIFPVEYAFVKRRTQELFEKHRPTLTVHCGMYSDAKAVIMEQVARNIGYSVADVKGDVPCSNCCVEGSPKQVLRTSLDLEKIALECETPIPVYISRNAGLYLCEYVYYCALNNCDKTLFLHLSAISAEFTLEKLVDTVKQIILLALKQCRQEFSESS